MRNTINAIAVILTMCCFLLFLVGIGANLYAYGKTNDVDGYLAQATVAGNAPQLECLLSKAVAEMERLGMMQGYTVIIPRKADNNMAVKYQTIKAMQQRASYVAQNAELYSLQESQALADLRDAIVNFRLGGTDWYLINHGILIIFWMPLPFAWAALGCLPMFVYKDKSGVLE